MTIHLVTGEYPPDSGGVADYTSLVAHELIRRGQTCRVWTRGASTDEEPGDVVVTRLGQRWDGGALRKLREGLLDAGKSERVLVQYVPQMYGRRAMNLGFSRTIAAVALQRSVELMFHEVAFPWVRKPLRTNLVAAANRLMARQLCRHARSAQVSIPAWAPLVRRMAPRSMPIAWSPVPSNIPSVDSKEGSRLRAELGISQAEPVIGHFGTYGGAISAMLDTALTSAIAVADDARVLLFGRGSKDWLAERRGKAWARAAIAIGAAPPERAAAALQASTVMLQPYPDGVSTRRGTAMACLANGRPLVTTVGTLSESFWQRRGIGVVADASETRRLGELAAGLLCEHERCERLSGQELELYASRFAISNTVDRILGEADPPSPEAI